MVKYSRQRELIYTYLMSTKAHPTAETVYKAVKEQCPNISLGTVYRNLTFLEQQGKIIKLSMGEDSERFDADTSRHYHFRCRCCGSVSDLKMMSLKHIKVIAGENFDGVIEDHMAYFTGVCGACKAKLAQQDLAAEEKTDSENASEKVSKKIKNK